MLPEARHSGFQESQTLSNVRERAGVEMNWHWLWAGSGLTVSDRAGLPVSSAELGELRASSPASVSLSGTVSVALHLKTAICTLSFLTDDEPPTPRFLVFLVVAHCLLPHARDAPAEQGIPSSSEDQMP